MSEFIFTHKVSESDLMVYLVIFYIKCGVI